MKEEIDLLELAKLLLRKRLIILAAMLLAVILATVYTFGFMEDEYSATTSLYVLNQTNSDNITSSDVSVSTNLVNDYREIIMSNRVTDRAEQALGLENLKAFDITVASKNNTRIIEITVVGKDASLATAVANELAEAFSQAAVEIMRVDNVSIIDAAQVPVKPSGPNRKLYILAAAAAAFVLAAGVFIAMDLLNTSMKTVQDVEEQTGLSVLAQFTQVSEKKGKRR